MKKKIVICASSSLHAEAEVWRGNLEAEGYRVTRHPTYSDTPEEYKAAHEEHYRKIADTDILFVLNKDAKGVANYIGPSVFAEIAFAIGLNLTHGKKIQIYTLNPLPEGLPHSGELMLWEKLGWIKTWGKGA